MLSTERHREFLTEQLVEVLTGIHQFLVSAGVQGEVRKVEDTLQFRHLLRVDEVDHIVAYE